MSAQFPGATQCSLSGTYSMDRFLAAVVSSPFRELPRELGLWHFALVYNIPTPPPPDSWDYTFDGLGNTIPLPSTWTHNIIL